MAHKNGYETMPTRTFEYIFGLPAIRMLAIEFVVFCAACFANVSFARAERLNISGMAFYTFHFEEGETPPNSGVFEWDEGDIIITVPVFFQPSYKTEENRLCRLTLIYRDNDSVQDIKVTLLGRKFVPGGNPFKASAVLATVSSNGASTSMRTASAAITTPPLIDPKDTFYYLRLDFPSAPLLQVVGVQIDYGTEPFCP
jgi:hypothetical protein